MRSSRDHFDEAGHRWGQPDSEHRHYGDSVDKGTGGRGDVGVGRTLLVAMMLLLSLLLWRRRGALGPRGIVS